MTNETKWSKPYFGVQHLSGLPRGWQVTVEDYETFSRVWVLAPGSGFTSVAETVADDAEAARAWGERQAQLLTGKAA